MRVSRLLEYYKCAVFVFDIFAFPFVESTTLARLSDMCVYEKNNISTFYHLSEAILFSYTYVSEF